MNQLKRLGASADLSRERFTMGENGAPEDQMVRAVTKVFVELYKQGLIYRAKRLVNWHPGLETAISDLEVENIEVNGHMWHLSYPIEGSDESHRRRHHPARDHARRHRRRRASRRRALQAPHRQVRDPAARRPPHPDRRRRIRRPGARLGRGEDHARRTTSTTSKSASASTRARSTSSRPAATINDNAPEEVPRPRPLRGAQADPRRPRSASASSITSRTRRSWCRTTRRPSSSSSSRT